MSTEENEQQPDTLGAAHIALLLAREPVARSIVERFPNDPPAYTNPAHTSVFEAARALVASEQAPSLDNIRFCLTKWGADGSEEYLAGLAVLDAEPTAESVALDAEAALQRAQEYETEMVPPEPKPEPMFKLMSLEELDALPPQEYLIENTLIEEGTSMLTAKEGSFKSFISLDMSLCIATGKAWHGYAVKQGPVIYVCAEGAGGLIKRVKAWCKENGESFPKNFYTIAVPTKIHQPAAKAGLVEACEQVKPNLVVLDTLARCAVGVNENDSNEMGQFIDSMTEISKSAKAHVMTVHHNNKGGDYRGTTALAGAMDSRFSMQTTSEEDKVIFKWEKQKDDGKENNIVFVKHVIQVTDDGKTSLVFRREFPEDEYNPYGGLSGVEVKVLQGLIEGWGYTGTTFTNWWSLVEGDGGISKSTFIRAKQRLLDKGYVQTDGKPRGASFVPVKKDGE